MTKWAFLMATCWAPSAVFAQTVRLEAPDDTFRTTVTLNEKVEARALIDTGASSLGLCANTALELQLSLGAPVELETSGGKVFGHRVRLSSIRIGRIVVRDVAAVVHPATPWCTEALIGLSVLRRLRAMTLQGNTLTLVGRKSVPPVGRPARGR